MPPEEQAGAREVGLCSAKVVQCLQAAGISERSRGWLGATQGSARNM